MTTYDVIIRQSFIYARSRTENLRNWFIPSLWFIANVMIQPQAKEIIAEEQANFRAGMSSTEQIFNLRILGEKYLQHQQNLYHVFIDFKKSFDRVWHEAIWATMRKYINASIIRAIENLHDKAQSAVLFNGSTGEWFRTTVGVRQGCLLSPTLNNFLEGIMCEALDDHEGSVSIGGRFITNFRFADDIVVNAEEEEEAGVLVDRLDTTTTRYKMEIGPDKTKVMTNNPNGFQREIKINCQMLEEVENFQVPWSNHLQRRIKTRDSFQDSPDNSSSF